MRTGRPSDRSTGLCTRSTVRGRGERARSGSMAVGQAVGPAGHTLMDPCSMQAQPSARAAPAQPLRPPAHRVDAVGAPGGAAPAVDSLLVAVTVFAVPLACRGCQGAQRTACEGGRRHAQAWARTELLCGHARAAPCLAAVYSNGPCSAAPTPAPQQPARARTGAAGLAPAARHLAAGAVSPGPARLAVGPRVLLGACTCEGGAGGRSRAKASAGWSGAGGRARGTRAGKFRRSSFPS